MDEDRDAIIEEKSAISDSEISKTDEEYTDLSNKKSIESQYLESKMEMNNFTVRIGNSWKI